jgi:ribosomal protein S18 acetylase RimI-like enzyme
MNEEFLARVDEGIQTAIETGWPHRTGAVWLVDDRPGSALSGSLGLTDEGDGTGRVRWFTLAAELRGRGLGRAMLGELLCEARGAGMRTLKLETFSALTTAAHLYRDAGFRVVAERQRLDWGPPISYQHYELKLA